MPPKVRFNPEIIIDLAFDYVRKNGGWEGLSARYIANEIGSSVGPIYTHFNSMKGLENKVVKKAITLFYDYLTAERTGDKWIDHGIGYVMFAKEESHLFQALFDRNYADLRKQYDQNVWDSLEDDLTDYEPFKALSKGQIGIIRRGFWVFVHGLASLITSASLPLEDDEAIIYSVSKASDIFLRGIKDDPETIKIADDDNLIRFLTDGNGVA
jgi:AcrR family transcriptional regulator